MDANTTSLWGNGSLLRTHVLLHDQPPNRRHSDSSRQTATPSLLGRFARTQPYESIYIYIGLGRDFPAHPLSGSQRVGIFCSTLLDE